MKTFNEKNIYLIGCMGAGKTRVGAILSQMLECAFIELDKEIEERATMSISNIFSEFGEDYFRNLESHLLREVSKKHNQVISTGGGAVIKEINRKIMDETGVAVYLRSPAEILWKRIKHDSSRPLLKVKNPLIKLTELLSQREEFYEQADVVIDTECLGLREVAREIVKRLDQDRLTPTEHL